MIDKILENLVDKNIAILGFGREGKETYKFIRKHLPMQKLVIIDVKDVSNDDLVKGDKNVSFVFGEDYLNNLDQYDLVIKTPGISLKNINVDNIKITSQIEMLLQVARGRVIGITGTKGKSTTTLLTYNILKENGLDVVCAGNMGIPVFSMLESIKDNTIIVVEMSSHQLEYLDVSPHIGVVLNLFEDHLDHAGTVQHYHEIKMHMFSNQNNDDYMIYCQDNDTLNNIIKENNYKGIKYSVDINNEATIYMKDEKIYYNNEVVFDSSIKRNLLGLHNLENIMVAYTISKILKLDDNKTMKAIEEFKPLEYRLEFIGVVDDVKYYVDTLATIPKATIDAIEAIPDINTLIFGGMDRGISYEGFAEYLTKTNIEHFICMPTTGHEIASNLPKDRVYLVDTLEEACKLAKKITKKNTTCILSPAAASYEHFKNYAEKGDKYKEYILNTK